METKTANKTSMEVIINLFDFHTKLFPNVIDGISDKDASNRLNTKANHAAWLAGSLVHERYELANSFGIELKQKSHELFKEHKGIQDNITYPSLSEFKKDWEKIIPALRNALVNLSEEQLEGPDPFGMPGDKVTLFDTIVFITHRESYCIGQIGLWRRLLGYAAMKYPDE